LLVAEAVEQHLAVVEVLVDTGPVLELLGQTQQQKLRLL
jgi:hypothetical protein